MGMHQDPQKQHAQQIEGHANVGTAVSGDVHGSVNIQQHQHYHQNTPTNMHEPQEAHNPPRNIWLLGCTIALISPLLVFLWGILGNLFSEQATIWIERTIGKEPYPIFIGLATITGLASFIAACFSFIKRAPWQGASSQPNQTDQWHNRHVLMEDLQQRYADRSKQAPKIIALHLAERDQAVQRPGAILRPYDLTLRTSGKPDLLLPKTTSLLNVFDQYGGQLLILGAPGIGKSFALHQLGDELVTRAKHTTTLPIPVIFSLASWRPEQTLLDWMISDLTKRFSVKPAIITQLFTTHTILPLLDGLDEVETLELRNQCVAAINKYRATQNRIPQLVITSREREYQDLHEQLVLNTAVVIQPLDPRQINYYLAGKSYLGLRQAMSQSPELAELAQIPLFLALIAETYKDQAPIWAVSHDPATLRKHILGDYIAYCCRPLAGSRVYRIPVESLQAFLAWLGRSMETPTNLQDFYLEFIQPDWLSSRNWQLIWRWLCALTCGLACSIAGWLLGVLGGQLSELPVVLLGGLIGGVLGGVQPNIILAETLSLNWIALRQKFINNLFIGPIGGLAGGLGFGLLGAPSRGSIEEQLGGLGFGLLVGLLGGFFGGLNGAIEVGLLTKRKWLNQGIHHSIRSMIIMGLAFILFFMLIFLLLGFTVFSIVFGLDIGLYFGFRFGLLGGIFGLFIFGILGGLSGGLTVVQHYILRLLLAWSTPAPLHFAPWLSEAHKRGLLVRVGGGYRFYHELLQRHFASYQEPGVTPVPMLAEEQAKTKS